MSPIVGISEAEIIIQGQENQEPSRSRSREPSHEVIRKSSSSDSIRRRSRPQRRLGVPNKTAEARSTRSDSQSQIRDPTTKTDFNYISDGEITRNLSQTSVVYMETVCAGTVNKDSADNISTEQLKGADDSQDPFEKKAKESKEGRKVQNDKLIARAEEGSNGHRESFDWGYAPSAVVQQSGAEDSDNQNNDQPQESSLVSSIPPSRRSSLPEEVQSHGSQSVYLREEATYESTAAEHRLPDDPDRLALAIITAPVKHAGPYLPQARSNITVNSVPQQLEHSYGSTLHDASRSSKRPFTGIDLRPTIVDIPDERTNKQRHIAARRLIRWFNNPYSLHSNINTSEISKGILNVDHLHSIFDSLDRENNGRLPNTYIKQVLTNPDSTPFQEPTITALMERLDTTDSSFLNFEDFCGLWGFVAAWRSLFDRYDEGRKGFFSIDDYITAMKGLEWEFLSQRGLRGYYRAYAMNNNDKMAFEIFIQSSLGLKSKVDRFKTYDPDGDGFTALSFEKYLGGKSLVYIRVLDFHCLIPIIYISVDIMQFSSGIDLFGPENWSSNVPQDLPEGPINTSYRTVIEDQALSRNEGPPYNGIEQSHIPSMDQRIGGLRNSVDRANRDSRDTALIVDKENRRRSFERIHSEPDLEEEPVSHLVTRFGEGEDVPVDRDRYVSGVPTPVVNRFSSYKQNERNFRSSSYGYGREQTYRRWADLDREEENIRQKKLWKEEVLEIAKKAAEEKNRKKVEQELKEKAIAEYIEEKERMETRKAESEMMLQRRMRNVLSKNGYSGVQIEKILSRGSDKPSVPAQVAFEDTDDLTNIKQRRSVGYQSSGDIPDITSYRTRSPLRTKLPPRRSEKRSSLFSEAEQETEPRLRRLARLARKAAENTLDAQLEEDLILNAVRKERLGLEWWDREALLFHPSGTTYDGDEPYCNSYRLRYSDNNSREKRKSEGEGGEAWHEDVYNAIASGRRKRMKENEKIYDELKAVPRRRIYREEIIPGQVSERERSRSDREELVIQERPKRRSQERERQRPRREEIVRDRPRERDRFSEDEIVMRELPKREEIYFSERPRERKVYNHGSIFQERRRERSAERKRAFEREASILKHLREDGLHKDRDIMIRELPDRSELTVPEHDRK